MLLIGGISFGVRRAAPRKCRRKLALLEQQHAVERDRARIAKDIHDDVGAGLTQITLLTELARREPAQAEANLGRITDAARRLTKAMDEIVWAVDPQHDTLAGLMDYVSARVQLDTGLKSWAGETPALLWRRSRQQRRTARPACPGKGEIPFTVRP